MSSDRAVSSPAECSAILSAYMDCLRFTMQENLGDGEEQLKVRQSLVMDQLIPLIDSSLKDPKLQSGPLFGQVEETVYSWEKKAGGQMSPEDVPKTYCAALTWFWESLERVCVTHVDVLEAGERELAGVSGLLQVMQNPNCSPKATKKKKAKIRFTDEEDDEKEDAQLEPSPAASPTAAPDGDRGLDGLRQERLQDLVCKLAELSMVYISEQGSHRHLRFLAALLGAFSSVRVFHVLLEPSGEDDSKKSPGNPAVQFLHQKLTVWLREGTQEDADFLVDILYSVLSCCPESAERKCLLDGLVKACSDSVKHSLICDWLKGDTLGDKLLSLASDLCSAGLIDRTRQQEPYRSDKWALLSLLLSEHVKNESLIAEIYVEKIIDQLHSALAQARDLSAAGEVEPSVSFICDVASNFFSSVKDCLAMPSAEDLLLTIFQLCAQPSDSTHLSEPLLLKLKHTWMSGLNSLVRQFHSIPRGSAFLNRSAQWVKDQMETSHLSVQSLQSLIVAVDDLHAKILQSGPSAAPILAEQVSRMMPSAERWQKMRQCLSGQWSSKPLLDGRLSMNSETSGTDLKSFPKTWLPHHLCTASLLSKMAFRMLENDAVTKDEETERRVNIAVAEMLYSLQWCEELERPPGIITECRHMLRTLDITHGRVKELAGCHPALLQLLYTRSMESGTIWSLTLHKLIHVIRPGIEELKPLTVGTQSYFPVTPGSLHTVQCLSPFLHAEEKESLIIQFVSRLMSCPASALSHTDEMKSQTAGMLTWHSARTGTLENTALDLVGLNVEIIRFFSHLLKYSASALPSLEDTEWDFILCSMLSWLETACESSARYHQPLVRLFACVSCNLAADLSAYFQTAPTSAAETLPAKRISEWNEFFSEGVRGLLLPLLVQITGENKAPETSYHTSVLQSLGQALCFISKEQLLNHKLPAKFVAGQKSRLSDRLQSLLNTLAPLLLYRDRAVQITVYHMLDKLMADLPAFDEDHSPEDEEEPALSPPAALMSVLALQEDLVETLLEGIQVGEFAVIQPLKEEFCSVLGYLLTWKLILTFFKAASSQLRALYSQYLRKTKSLNKLLYNLFRLMPHMPILPGQAGDASCKEPRTFFMEELDLSVQGCSTLQYEIPHLACCVYHITLKDLPAMVRLWWNGCEKRIFNVVDKFTTKYVSGVLSSQEISSVQSSTQMFDGMTVKARPTTREVIATYSVDDICIELIIQLPQNYPLGSIFVESGRRVGVAVQQWRNWMLQLSTYLTHQNGSIMEGLALWKNNVDKRFEGVEDCMICFSVIHGSNYSLPKKACRTCKKKFHSQCLSMGPASACLPVFLSILVYRERAFSLDDVDEESPALFTSLTRSSIPAELQAKLALLSEVHAAHHPCSVDLVTDSL
ncbi:hypothetical protein GDO78_008978 [Eleutherodactylus coqui]|uniref:E3 ubiquitin-protein ligase listerin n=1 Tax=Eleutherodactylus coqui TaxID=57060 RepID=A0A8J6FER7_ELECQ|nr:hypothetical protein GDO78_008978 [Eleutherodactylus coqui]